MEANANTLDRLREQEVVTDVHIEPPRLFNVVFFDDDRTPMEFVVETLMRYFALTQERAEQVMLQVHNHGSAVAGTYIYDIAEAKVLETKRHARRSGFPLHCAAQPESCAGSA